MSLVTIDVDLRTFTPVIQRKVSRLPVTVERFLDEAGRKTEATMRSHAPQRSGQLAASIRTDRHEHAVVVGPTVAYARFVEAGTRPHVIEPRLRRALRFTVGGEVVFARRVQHPGTIGRFFVRQTALEVGRDLPQLARQLVREALA